MHCELKRGQLIAVRDQRVAVNLRDSTQQVFDREVWNNHLVLLNSRHAILFLNSHSDRGRRKRASGLSQHPVEEKKKCRDGSGGVTREEVK